MIQNQKHQSLIIIAISLALIAYATKGFLKEQTAMQYFSTVMIICLLSFAIIGAWFRKTWVQYCFFFIATYSLLITIFTLLAMSVGGCCSLDNLFLIINVSTVLYIFTLTYYATAYLAKHFFDEKVSLQRNKFTGCLLVSGIASCAMAAPILGSILMRLMISNAQTERLNMAIFGILNSWNIAESWWLLAVSIPSLLLNASLVMIIVFISSRLLKVWSRWHVYMGALYIFSFFLLVLCLQYLIAFIKGRELYAIAPEIAWHSMSVILISFFTAGLLAVNRKQ
ncbi:hypothetical protein [Methylotenera sp. L2L1]|uniref:hypothetical protein n=1 Tax=Methylotenera sp. L2L1 TaxID=1502770 RepID=UPI00056B0655|nr:hypothetical protein [Methylotenera sp. L2L1]